MRNATEKDKLYLVHIIESIELIGEFTEGLTKELFLADRKTYLATIRCLETASDATKKLSSATKDMADDFEWHKVAAFRNVLVHEYLGDIDDEAVWNVIQNHLNTLKITALKILDKLED